MPDYIIDFTDPANGSFVIKPYTTNGPLTPINPTPLDPQAVAANTSIVLLGQGMYAYGERFQESIVHMLEHFSYQSRPYYPVQGQIWYKNANFVDGLNPTDPVDAGLYLWDGAAWQTIVIGSLPLTGDLDMGGFNIINLANPPDTDGQDAVTVNFANDTYLRLDATNDPVTGVLTVANDIILTGGLSQITLPNAPTAGTDAVNRDYVLGLSLNDHVDVAIVGPVLGEFLQYNGVDWTNVATAIPTTLDSLSDVIITAPNVGDVLTFDGANWIDQAPAAFVDRYVTSGTMSGTTLTLSFSTAVPSPTISIVGIAPDGHTHTTQNIFHDENPQGFDSSYIRDARVSTVATPNPSFPQADSFNNVVDALDQAVYASRAPVKRRVLQSDGTIGPYLTPEYTTYANKLNVSVNGVKQYVSARGTATFLLDTPTATSASNTGLSVTDYAIAAVVTGIPGTGNFQIVGNVTATFPAGTEFSVIGSTGNDDVWVVTTSTFVGPNTEIEVTATITNAVADGIISVVGVLDYRFGINVDTLDFPAGTTVTNVTVRPAPLEVSLVITNVSTGLDTFTVANDYTSVFTAGRAFVVTGSTGNDGTWQVLSSTLTAGNTVITIDTTPSIVAQTDITDATIDGLIAVGYVSFAGLIEEMQIEADLALANDVTVAFRDSAINFVPDSFGNTSTVDLVNPSSGTNLWNTLDTSFTASEILYDGYDSEVDIAAVQTGTDIFEVVGDYTAAFPAGARFTVQGTSGWTVGIPIDHGDNDGVFQVTSSTFVGPNTEITVTANLTVNTGATGTIYFARELAYEENGTPYSQSLPGSSITFITAPTAGALIEVTVAP